MAKTATKFERASDTELVMERAFAAPRPLVWRAWTEPDMIARWWGPGATTEIRQMDVRPGGAWHYCMRSDEWGEAWGRMVYQEVVAPERLVYRDAFSNEQGDMIPPESLSTLLFLERDGGTLLQGRTVYSSAEDLQKVIDMGVEQGMNMTLDQLEELLRTMEAS